MACTDYTECLLDSDVPAAKPSRAPTYTDVARFFADPLECSINIIYLRSSRDGDVKRSVNVKLLQDCAHFFSSRGSYFYVYARLFYQMMAWSRHPRSFGEQGYLGNHITIGPGQARQGTTSLDIHETIYTTVNSAVGNYALIFNKIQRNYSIDRSTHQLMQTQQQQHSDQLAPILWNEILASIDCPACMHVDASVAQPRQDGGQVVVLKKSKKTRKDMTVLELFAIIEKRLEKVQMHLHVKGLTSHGLFMRVPYIAKTKELHLQKRLRLLIERKYPNISADSMLWNDHYSRQSLMVAP